LYFCNFFLDSTHTLESKLQLKQQSQ
jgi:hypothetical protein